MKHILFLCHAVCISDQSFMVDLFITCTIELMWIDTSMLCIYFFSVSNFRHDDDEVNNDVVTHVLKSKSHEIHYMSDVATECSCSIFSRFCCHILVL